MIDYQIFRRVERGREGGKCEDECVGYKATSRHASGSASCSTIEDWHSPTSASEKKKKNVVGIVIANPFIDQRCWDYIVGSFRS